jgi:hypothetical protein
LWPGAEKVTVLLVAAADWQMPATARLASPAGRLAWFFCARQRLARPVVLAACLAGESDALRPHLEHLVVLGNQVVRKEALLHVWKDGDGRLVKAEADLLLALGAGLDRPAARARVEVIRPGGLGPIPPEERLGGRAQVQLLAASQ